MKYQAAGNPVIRDDIEMGTGDDLIHGLFPKRITLELTNHCNLQCTFCPRRLMGKERGFMDSGLARRLLDEAAGHAPVAMVPFFRGESLLHPDWFGILQYAREKNIGEIQFTTNATLLTPQCTDRLLSLNLDFISFSLDTLDPGVYEKERKGASFQKTLENIGYFLKRKEECKSPMIVQVSAVETDSNRKEMGDFVTFWKDRVDRVRIYVEHSADDQPGSITQALPTFEKRLPCRKLYADTVICWNGEVALCNHDWCRTNDGPTIGNVRQSDIETIWNSSSYNTLRQRHLNGDLGTISPCDKCDHWKMYYLPDRFIGRLYE